MKEKVKDWVKPFESKMTTYEKLDNEQKRQSNIPLEVFACEGGPSTHPNRPAGTGSQGRKVAFLCSIYTQKEKNTKKENMFE